jgi:archaemetzincin
MEKVLYLVPIGKVDEDILTVLCEALEGVFLTPCEVSPAQPSPSYAYNERRQQYLSSSILREMGELSLPGAYRLLGVVDLDLYVPELNFVFGQASLKGKEAIIALPRLRQAFYGLPETPDLFRKRAVKEAIHELGHTHGLPHCPDRLCVMHFSNSLRDTDIKDSSFCRNCRQELGRQRRT